MKKLLKFIKDEDGATMVEYALMLALIAAICITIVGTLGSSASTTFNNVNSQMPS